VSIAERLHEVRRHIDEAARRAGRDPSQVRLVAVSKLQPPEAIREAYAAGQRLFGENYVQELVAKAADLVDLPDLRWHFIGHLQRNKVKHVIDRVRVIESLDSERLLAEVDARAAAAGVELDVLVQVHIGEEETKSGCAPGDLGALLARADASRRVRLRGLMVLPPYELDPDEARPYFEALRGLRDAHGGSARLPELSMGMSHDFEVAIEEGATIVRVGTAIFGPR
jgi:pyridoxal phosphate enzyme (YggS family)